MITCIICSENKESRFFLNGETCCSCAYKIKMSNSEIDTKLCRSCRNHIIKEDGLKMRTVFCSDKCLNEYHTHKRKYYFTKICMDISYGMKMN